MGTRTSYPPEVKAAAIAALAAGTPATKVAVEYNVTVATVRSWKAREVKELAPIVPRNERAEFGQLVLEFLRAEIKALHAQALQFADPEWLKDQSAEHLAVLHGVCTDKAIILLAAIEADVDGGGTSADAAL